MNRSGILICVRLVLTLAAMCSGPISANAEEPLEIRLREIRKTWLSIASSVDSCSCEATHSLSRGEETKPIEIDNETRRRLILTKAGSLAEFRTKQAKGGKLVFDEHILHLANEHYSCSLQDKAGDDRFIITSPPYIREKNWAEDPTSPEKLRCGLPWLLPTDTFNLLDLIDPKLSEIKSIEELGDGLLRIPLGPRSDLSKNERDKFRGVTSGVLVLNRKLHYRLETAEIQFDPKFSQKSVFRLTYDATPNREYLLKRIESATTFFLDIKGIRIAKTAKSEIDFECRHNIEFEPHALFISHYGLPEVVGITPPKKSIPNYVLLLAAALVMGVISVLLRWMVKHRIAPAPKA